MALAFPVFKIERFCSEIPIASASSFERIFLLASMTSKLMIMGMFILYELVLLVIYAFEPIPIINFSRFCGSFEPIFDPILGDNILLSILPPKIGSKIGQNNTQNRRKILSG